MNIAMMDYDWYRRNYYNYFCLFADIDFRIFSLAVLIEWQRLLDIWNMLFRLGSQLFTRVFRFKLVGSSKNWHSMFLSSKSLENSILFLSVLHKCSSSSNFVSLTSLYAQHDVRMCEIVSLVFTSPQTLQWGEPPGFLVICEVVTTQHFEVTSAQL